MLIGSTEIDYCSRDSCNVDLVELWEGQAISAFSTSFIYLFLVLGLGYQRTLLLQFFWCPWRLYFRHDFCIWCNETVDNKV